jgi:hypothetical protein
MIRLAAVANRLSAWLLATNVAILAPEAWAVSSSMGPKAGRGPASIAIAHKG